MTTTAFPLVVWLLTPVSSAVGVDTGECSDLAVPPPEAAEVGVRATELCFPIVTTRVRVSARVRVAVRAREVCLRDAVPGSFATAGEDEGRPLCEPGALSKPRTGVPIAGVVAAGENSGFGFGMAGLLLVAVVMVGVLLLGRGRGMGTRGDAPGS